MTETSPHHAIARMALRIASPYIADMAPRVRQGATPAKSPMDDAAARECERLGEWLDGQPDSVKVGLDELAALDLTDEDDGHGEG